MSHWSCKWTFGKGLSSPVSRLVSDLCSFSAPWTMLCPSHIHSKSIRSRKVSSDDGHIVIICDLNEAVINND